MRLMRCAVLLSAAWFAVLEVACVSSDTVPSESWSCDWDASEARPLGAPGSPVNDGGALTAAQCQATCGPPVSTCTAMELDSGVPGALCPVCTF